jgi:photosystem II stability/assembly factor-like uncharacterized protein
MKMLSAPPVALAFLLIGGCELVPSTATLEPSPALAPSVAAAPTGGPSAAARTSSSAERDFAFRPPVQNLDAKTAFAYSDGGGLLRSNNAGRTWTEIGRPPRLDELRMIDHMRGWGVVFFGRDQPQIGCQQASTAAPCHSAVAVTDDGWRTWSVRLTNGLNPGGGVSIDHLQAVDATHAWVLVTTTCDQGGVCDKELRATADGGITWRTLRSGRLTQLRVASLGRAWLGADSERGSVIYGTSDGGVTWRQQLATEQPVLALDAASERDAWALTRDGGYCTSSTCQRYELLMTRDGGFSWTSLGNPKDNVVAGATCTFGHLAGPLFASPQIGWLGVGRGVGGVLGSGGTMRTNDGGRTWTCSVAPPDAERLSAADPDHVLALTRDSQTAAYALWLSTDGGRTWTSIVPR